MTEEKKEKPDWLSDFQNNQATSGKQTFNQSETNKITVDLCEPVINYVSPCYGRRSLTGAKSVENSPKKGCPAESKSVSARSSSARPALLNNKISPNEIRSDVYEEPNSENFVSSLEILQNELENFSFRDFSESLDSRSNSGGEHLIGSKLNSENLEDSWDSLNTFNIKQKGRLRPSKKNETSREVEEDKHKKKHYQRHQHPNESTPKTDEPYNIISPEYVMSKQIKENWRERRKTNESRPLNKTNVNKSDTVDFIIPELPRGRNLVFNIKTTWGDKHYLGLSGIEIFNSKGKKVQVKSIKADPPNINILPEYSKDPRVVENLIDNIYLTQDDMHMWLVPFTPNSAHLIFIEFYETEELAMLRIWNYNKSRIHCFRGAKDVEIKLDDNFIFIGEIARASGEILNTLNCLGDTILFTTDEDILESVAENDDYFSYSISNNIEEDHTKQEELRPLTGGNKEKQLRPFTCTNKKACGSEEYQDAYQYQGRQKNILDPEHKNLGSLEITQDKFNDSLDEASILQTLRHIDGGIIKQEGTLEKVSKQVKNTGMALDELEQDFGEQTSVPAAEVKSNEKYEQDPPVSKSEFLDKNFTLYIPSASFLPSDSTYETLSMPTGYIFTIQIHSTWGDLYYVGLNGIQMFDENNMEIKVHPNDITADPESVNMLEEIENDARTPDKLVDGINDSTDGCHMWLAPVLPLTINRIHLTFQNPTTLSSLKLWNYAKTPSRGVREFGILVDGLLIYNGELEQAVVTAEGVPRVPCKTVNFSDPKRVQSNKIYAKQREETFSRSLYSADQSQRPLTTMTSQS